MKSAEALSTVGGRRSNRQTNKTSCLFDGWMTTMCFDRERAALRCVVFHLLTSMPCN